MIPSLLRPGPIWRLSLHPCRRRARALPMLVAILFLAGCSADSTGPAPATPAPTSIVRVDGDAQSGIVGEPLPTPLSVKVLDEQGRPMAGISVNWSVTAGGGSMNPGAAATDERGVASTTWTLGLDHGEQAATAKSGSLAAVAFHATGLPVPVASVRVEPVEATVFVDGPPVQFSAILRDEAGNVLTGRTVTWVSSDSAVANVFGAGSVSGASPGTAVVTASSEGKSGTATITVLPPPPVAEVLVRVASDRIIEGAKTEIAEAALLADDGMVLTNRSVNWTTTNATVATVDADGRIDPKSPGTTELIASAEGQSDRVTITVEPRSRYERDRATQWYFIDGSDPRMPAFDEQRGGSVPAPGDMREQIVVDETFTVPAGTETRWEDKIVWVRPKARANILVHGTLVIRNTLMLWDQTEHQQTRIDVQSGGTLHIENSYAFSSNRFWINWDYQDGATVYLNRFQGNPWTSAYGQIHYTAVNASVVTMSIFPKVLDSSIDLHDAAAVWLELILPTGTHDITLPPRYNWRDLDIPGIWPGTTIRGTNIWMFRSDVSLDNDVHATVRDVTTGMGVGWTFHSGTEYIECELRGLGSPDAVGGVMYADESWDMPCNNSSLRLVNTRLLDSWPNIYGAVRMKLYDSYTIDLRNFGSGAAQKPTMEVYNSYVENLSVTNGGETYIENSVLKYDVQVNGTGSKVYSFGLRTLDGSPVRFTEESGGRYIVLDAAGPPW